MSRDRLRESRAVTKGSGRIAPERRRTWVRLDNAANIFLATRTEIDTKVFRLVAELDQEIDPVVLQQALDRVYAQYPLFRAVLRRGVFWYYLQESKRSPVIAEDVAPSVTHLYRFDSRELLFRVLFRGRRISLEIFHALTDGTGSLWFFQDLLTEYVGLRHPEELDDAAPMSPAGVKQEFTADAFTHFFRTSTRSIPFAQNASGAAESASTVLAKESPIPPSLRSRVAKLGRHRRRRVMRIRGTHTPDLRTRVVELSMPVKPVLALARAENASLTIYLVALLFEALRSVRTPRERGETMTVSVPVNLRHFFPTDSGRNFFATTMLAHTFADDPDAGDRAADSLSGVCHDLDAQLQSQLTHASLERRIRRLIAFERHPMLRVIPRPIKDGILSIVSWFSNRGITVAVSNLGRVTLPDPANSHVGRLYFHVSAVRPQFCAMSHDDQLTVSFTSPFVETGYHAAFVRQLTDRGVPVVVNVTRVTPEELEAGA